MKQPEHFLAYFLIQMRIENDKIHIKEMKENKKYNNAKMMIDKLKQR